MFIISCLIPSISYPAVYIITVLPVGVVRFRSFHSQNVPYAATIFADILFCSSGLFNVILFSVTRPALLPYRDRELDLLPFTAPDAVSTRTFELSTTNSNISQLKISVGDWKEKTVNINTMEKNDSDEATDGSPADD